MKAQRMCEPSVISYDYYLGVDLNFNVIMRKGQSLMLHD